ncbi:MAG: glycosyltransferase [Acetatifactor sp.]|nr:glycosyltransferase [Acetatifactor sp.]
MTEQDTNRVPLVSVIIPTYNRVHTLPASIDSVLRQTYDHLELIVVDDGSTDGTESFVRGLTDGRVRYVRNTGNHGPAAARNLGVRLAQGEYVAFQDSDDEWHPDKLEKQMPLLLNPEDNIELVYCEYTRYHGQTKRETIPSKALPSGCKQGDILPVLLLQPLIGTPAIVVKKSCFAQVGGFNEDLATFEDYEFTVRFSQKHRIGFVEETLVKVNDSPDSVDKRFADRIRTQAYIVREMITPFKEYELLWEKLYALQETAEHFKCHDVFLEELHGMADLFLTEQEKENAARLAEKTERSDAKQNQRKEIAQEALAQAKQQLVEMYVSVYGGVTAEEAALEQVLRQVKDCLDESIECFEIPEESRSVYSLADSQSSRVSGFDPKLECLSLLADTVKTVEELERYIYRQQADCNVCGGRYYRNSSHRCPYCEADDRERLLIAFLQDLRPEVGEKLTVLQMTSSRLLENYLQNRQDIQCDSLNPELGDEQDLQGFEGEQYDILICPDLISQAGNTDEMALKWSRIMKNGGVCLVFPASGREGDRVKRLAAAELYVNEVGEEWFGAEFYRKHQIDSGMVLVVLTKDGPLSEL